MGLPLKIFKRMGRCCNQREKGAIYSSYECFEEYGFRCRGSRCTGSGSCSKFAASCCPYDMVFERDALGIIKALQAEQPDQSRLGNIIDQAKHQAPLLRSTSFVYVPGPGGWGKR